MEMRESVVVQFLEYMEEIVDSDGDWITKLETVKAIAQKNGFSSTLEEFFNWSAEEV